MIPEVRRKVAEANSRLAIGDFTTMEAAVEDSLGAQRMAAEVVGVFGGLALLITVVGLYGLLSYLVEQRTQEIGIRMALGADRGAVVGMVLPGDGGVEQPAAAWISVWGERYGSVDDGVGAAGAGDLRVAGGGGSGSEGGGGESGGGVKGGVKLGFQGWPAKG
jgi:hypothetical protein